MGNNELPLVTIKCTAYNHELFLRKCLDGFVMQKTNFKFEAIVHDDASTDGTANIIREYAEKYPSIIKPIYETENQFTKGKLAKIMDDAITGKYAAICEGDDYWTDPHKLQRQVDFLEAHPDYSAVSENGMVLNTITDTQYLFSEESEHDVNIEELIIKRRFPTASVMYRVASSQGIFNTCHCLYDTMRWCYLTSKGKFRYLTNVSSVYRRGNQGVVEGTDKYLWAQTIEKRNLELIRVFGDYYNIEISYQEIWTHYMASLNAYRYSDKRSFLSLIKCFKYEPLKTIGHIISKPLKIIKRVIR
jgi:glycosyltransferase involved in cell wall biosynthesis